MNTPNKFNYKIALTFFRVMIGIILMKDFFIYFQFRTLLFPEKGIVDFSTYQDISKLYHLEWLYLDFTSTPVLNVFCISGMIFSVFLFMGFFTRISAIILFFQLFIVKIRMIFMQDGADNFVMVMLPFLAITDSISLSDRYESLKKKIFSFFEPYQEILNIWMYRAMILQICIVYFFAGLHKLQGETWLDGSALYYILNSSDFSASSTNAFITKWPWVVNLMTWSTIVFQLAFPFLVWVKKLRPFVLLTGLGLHLGIFLFMRIDNFSYVMIAAYTLFLNDNLYLSAYKKVISKKWVYATT